MRLYCYVTKIGCWVLLIVPKEEESDESDSEDETNRQITEAVGKLSPEITKRYARLFVTLVMRPGTHSVHFCRYGEIVWAKMVGFPYWPGLIADPRILNHNLQSMVRKELETKYMVYFYRTENWYAALLTE